MASMFKEFVTEKEIEEVKKKRQEEWEKVRRPDQPLVRQEEDYDHRSLYEKLKSQKDKVDADKAEQLKFKNMIYKGLDDDESKFLSMVYQQQAQQQAERLQQEKEEILLFREAVEKVVDEEKPALPSQVKPLPRATPKPSNSVSRSAGLTGLVRVKRKSKSDDTSSTKKIRSEDNADHSSVTSRNTTKHVDTNNTTTTTTQRIICDYSDSSDDSS
ncbi:PSME3-interacting protein-like isoform X2 [Dysidea avara]|uniref:PSME3-interacting protein-like isoform X2 n=1 Tax=Dysidea avara TaxID=196820 RepID=UPI0033331BE5